MQILMQRGWGGARASAFVTSSRQAGVQRGPPGHGTPEVLAPGQSAVRTRDKWPCAGAERHCRDVRVLGRRGGVLISQLRELAA